MPRQLYCSPQIDRFLITCLYFQAQAEKVPMTVLTNRLLELCPPPGKTTDPGFARWEGGSGGVTGLEYRTMAQTTV